jgi:hypothetical protein
MKYIIGKYIMGKNTIDNRKYTIHNSEISNKE